MQKKEKAVGWHTAHVLMLLFSMKTSVKESHNFDLKKKKNKNNKKNKNKKKNMNKKKSMNKKRKEEEEEDKKVLAV